MVKNARIKKYKQKQTAGVFTLASSMPARQESADV
jgi:hypothetical protein